MQDNSVIIIGAGIAGLAAGVYGQQNGYRTEIFELHGKPGGLCTAWTRKGYTFDGCIHWLMGTSPRSPFYAMWEELGATQGRKMIAHDEFNRIVEPDGKTLIVYTNHNRLEAHLKELAPQDGRVIDEFMREMRHFANYNPPFGKPREAAGLLDSAKGLVNMVPWLPALMKWSKITAGEFAARFKDPFLRRSFPLIFGSPDMPMIAYFMFLGGMDHGDSGWPERGSLAFAEDIARRYEELGGCIHYNAPVAKILTEDGPGGSRATGVRLADGSEHRAARVISAADGHATLFDMLEGRFLSDEIRSYYDHLPIFKGAVQVSLGVKRDLSSEPHAVSYVLADPVTVSGGPVSNILIKHYCYDPSMAPAGRSTITSLFEADHAYWKDMAADPERYESEKQRAAEAVIDVLERRYPGITADIETVDVSTPLTTERYTGNWQGSTEGWLITDKRVMGLVTKGMAHTLPGLSNFRMVGQWVEPGGGIPGVAPSGMNAIQVLCHEDGKPFIGKVVR